MRLSVLLPILLFFVAGIEYCGATSAALYLKGTVTEPTCVVSQGSKEQTVYLGDWNTKALNGQIGKVTTAKAFQIYLQGCPSNTVSIIFNGEKSPLNSELLKLSAGSTAGNIAVEILDSNLTSLPLGQNSQPVKVDTSGIVGLSFYARFKTVATTVHAGIASADATFILAYD